MNKKLSLLLIIGFFFLSQKSFLCAHNESTKTKNLLNMHYMTNLDADHAKSLSESFIREKKVDVQLLEPYSDWLCTQAQSIRGNWKTHLSEQLIFFNDAIKIYEVYSLRDSNPIKGGTSIRKLIIKSQRFFSLNKTITLRSKKDGYSFDSLRGVNADNSFCILRYNSIKQYEFVHSKRIIKPKKCTHSFDVINLKTLKPITLTENIVACCFGSSDELYTINNEGLVELIDLNSNNKQQIIKLDIAHINDVMKGKMRFDIDESQNVKDITSNTTGTSLVVATQNYIFIINKSKKNVDLKIDGFGFNIKRIILNNAGSEVCIITKKHEFLYDTTQPKYALFLGVTLKNYHPPLSHNTSLYLSNVHVTWEKNDDLLINSCEYYYKKKDYTTITQSFAGTQCAFVIPHSRNGWSQKSLYKDSIDLAVSQDGRKLIITDKTGWFTKTKMVTLCDENMSEALRYFDTSKPHELDHNNQRLQGIILLYNIFKHNKKTVQLGPVVTEIYNNCLPDAVKQMLKKTHSITLFKRK